MSLPTRTVNNKTGHIVSVFQLDMYISISVYFNTNCSNACGILFLFRDGKCNDTSSIASLNRPETEPLLDESESPHEAEGKADT